MACSIKIKDSNVDDPTFWCRDSTCTKKFTLERNRNRHEKLFGHTVTKRISLGDKPLFDDEKNIYCCPSPGCQTKSTFKRSIQRHLSAGCSGYKIRKAKRESNKVCNFCGMEFTKKYNRDRHVKKVHTGDIEQPVLSIGDTVEDNLIAEMQEIESNTITHQSEVEMPCDTANMIEVSFLSDDGTVLDLSMSIVDANTPIYEVFQPNEVYDSTMIQSENTAEVVDRDVSPEVLSSDATANNGQNKEPVTCSDDLTVNNNQSYYDNILKELMSKAGERDTKFEQAFLNKILTGIETNLRSRDKKKAAANFLCVTLGDDLINDNNFLRWLSKKLHYKLVRLLDILANRDKTFEPRNTLDQGIYQHIYNYWLSEEVSTPSVESRNSRDAVKVSKLDFFKNYHHMDNITDTNISELEVTLKKKGTKKIYMSSQRMIYHSSVKKLHEDFCKDTGIKCSFSTFYKYKPFYVAPPTEREKLSCLCKVCQNIHLLLKGKRS